MDFTQIAYRSVASQTFTHDDLVNILQTAREHNAANGITGLLIYEHGRFVQWLEGPNKALEKLYQSIYRDPRHTQIERLIVYPRSTRLFPNWSMQLGAKELHENIPQSVEIKEKLIAESSKHPDRVTQLFPAISLEISLPKIDSLAHAAIDLDVQAWRIFSQSVQELKPPLWALQSQCMGPLTRALGDDWLNDKCSDTDLLFCTSRLQAILRNLADFNFAKTELTSKVLVATMPNETHLLGASIASHALREQGCRVEVCFQATLEELEHHVSQDAIDAMHIALSDYVSQDYLMPQLTELISQIRQVSLNPHLLILVTGRSFF
jgi:methanogenic corrinoid protein MtbC1